MWCMYDWAVWRLAVLCFSRCLTANGKCEWPMGHNGKASAFRTESSRGFGCLLRYARYIYIYIHFYVLKRNNWSKIINNDVIIFHILSSFRDFSPVRHVLSRVSHISMVLTRTNQRTSLDKWQQMD